MLRLDQAKKKKRLRYMIYAQITHIYTQIRLEQKFNYVKKKKQLKWFLIISIKWDPIFNNSVAMLMSNSVSRRQVTSRINGNM